GIAKPGENIVVEPLGINFYDSRIDMQIVTANELALHGHKLGLLCDRIAKTRCDRKPDLILVGCGERVQRNPAIAWNEEADASCARARTYHSIAHVGVAELNSPELGLEQEIGLQTEDGVILVEFSERAHRDAIIRPDIEEQPV